MVASLQIGTVASYYAKEYYHGGERQLAATWFSRHGSFGLDHGSAVDVDLFERLHSGLDSSGRTLLTTSGREIHGLDLCFSPGKTVSVAYALSEDDDFRASILEAHHRAVRAALELLEDEAIYTRRGCGGLRREKVALTAALFTHDSSRPEQHADGSIRADPQIHTHAVLLNLCQRKDGSIGSIDTRLGFYKLCIGAVYHAYSAAYLQEIGLKVIEVGRNGTFEIAGVPQALRQDFSARREKIAEFLDAAGLGHADDPKVAAAAALQTRRQKQEHQSGEERFSSWRARARDLGFEPARVLEQIRLGRQQVLEPSPSIEARLAALPDTLTTTEAAFPRRELLRETAAAHVGTSAEPSRLREWIVTLLGNGSVVEVRRSPIGEPVYSTPEMIRVEAGVLEAARDLGRRVWRGVDDVQLREAAAEQGLSEEQHDALTTLAGPNMLAFLEGKAGTGKTRVLRPFVAQLKAEGYRVIAAAPAWRTARMLSEELGVEAKAVDAWLASARAGSSFCDRRTVVIVDEAGQTGARATLALLQAVREQVPGDAVGAAEAKIVMIGDRAQLQPIAAGAGLSIVGRAVTGAALATVHRQRRPEMREAVEHLARGEVDEALTAVEALGSVSRVRGQRAVVETAVDLWEKARVARPEASHLLLARTNASVHRLNVEARRRRRDRGELKGEDVSIRVATPSGQTFDLPLAAGDRVRFGTRVDALGVINGTTGRVETVRALTDGHAELSVDLGDRKVTFDTRVAVDRRGRVRLAHDYATTVYSAQGLTAESCTVHLEPSFDRHDTYVASSRARDALNLVLDDEALDLIAQADRRLYAPRTCVEPEERRAALLRRLSRERKKETTLALSEPHQANPTAGSRGREQGREPAQEL